MGQIHIKERLRDFIKFQNVGTTFQNVETPFHNHDINPCNRLTCSDIKEPHFTIMKQPFTFKEQAPFEKKHI